LEARQTGVVLIEISIADVIVLVGFELGPYPV
jgi:hypothetical protein